MAWVIEHSQQTGIGFVTLLMIANHANAEGQKSFPSMKTLAKECRLSVRTIQRTILRLESSGELAVDRSSGRASHCYSLPLMPNVDTESTLPKRQRRQQESTLNSSNLDTESMLERGHSVHVEPQRGQEGSSNVDSGGSNVDTTESTEPYNRNTNHKEPTPLARLMGFLEKQNGVINRGKEAKAAKRILEKFTAEEAEACYFHLASQDWRSIAVTWTHVLPEIGTFVKRQQPNGRSEGGEKILSDYGDWYTVEGEDGTPSKRYRTAEAFARETGRNQTEVEARWN